MEDISTIIGKQMQNTNLHHIMCALLLPVKINMAAAVVLIFH